MRWAIFDGIPDAEVQRVLSIARRRTFARGEVVFHQHDPADTLHLIASGRFAARVQTGVGDTAIRVWHTPGKRHLTAFGLEAPAESLARLERYIALAFEAGIEPVIVLTKTDRVADRQPYVDAAVARL